MWLLALVIFDQAKASCDRNNFKIYLWFGKDLCLNCLPCDSLVLKSALRFRVCWFSACTVPRFDGKMEHVSAIISRALCDTFSLTAFSAK